MSDQNTFSDAALLQRAKAYQLMGLQETLPKAELFEPLSSDQVEAIAVALDDLDGEISQITRDIEQQSRDGKEVVFCLDSDVMRMPIDHDLYQEPISNVYDEFSRYDSEFWSSIVLASNIDNIVLLPCTMFEVLNYLKAIDSFNLNRSELALYQGLSKAVYAANLNEIGKKENINPLYKAIKRQDFSEKRLFLLKVVSRLLRETDRDFPSPIRRIYRSAVTFLTRGSRLGRTINNRIDAMNIATICAMNSDQSRHKRNKRHVLVSNTKLLADFSEDIPEIYKLHKDRVRDEDLIWAPKRAALFRILMRKPEESYRNALDLKRSIIDMKALLAENRDSNLGFTFSKLRADDRFLNLIGSLSFINQRLNLQESLDDILEIEFENIDEDADKLYNSIERIINKELGASEYSFIMREEIDLDYHFSVKSDLPGLLGVAGLYDSEKTERAGKTVLEDRTVYYVNQARGNGRIVRVAGFVDVINDLINSLLEKVTLGDFQFDEDWYTNSAEKQRRVLLGLNNGEVKDISFDGVFDLDGALRKHGLQSKSIKDFRIDTALFSASFDPICGAISAQNSLDIREEVAEFVTRVHDLIYDDCTLSANNPSMVQLLAFQEDEI